MKRIIYILMLIPFSLLGQKDSLDYVVIAGHPVLSSGSSNINAEQISNLLPCDSVAYDFCSSCVRKKKHQMKIIELYNKYSKIKDSSSGWEDALYKTILVIYVGEKPYFLGFIDGSLENIYVNGFKVKFDDRDFKCLNRIIPKKCKNLIQYPKWALGR